MCFMYKYRIGLDPQKMKNKSSDTFVLLQIRVTGVGTRLHFLIQCFHTATSKQLDLLGKFI